MGNKNSGRRPHPTAMRVLRGNPGKGPLNQNEPKWPLPDETFDAVPPELEGDPVAVTEWNRLAPKVRTIRLVGEGERGTLLSLCQQWSRYLMAHQKVVTMGMVVADKHGAPITNPYIRIEDKALTQCLRLWVELGLTPSSRSRISQLPSAEAPTVSKWAGLL